MPWHDWLLAAAALISWLLAVTFICMWMWMRGEQRMPPPPRHREWVDDRTEQRDVDGWLR